MQKQQWQTRTARLCAVYGWLNAFFGAFSIAWLIRDTTAGEPLMAATVLSAIMCPPVAVLMFWLRAQVLSWDR